MKKKVVIFMIAMVSGEFAGILLIFALLIFFSTGDSNNAVRDHSVVSYKEPEQKTDPSFNITAKVEISKGIIFVKEDILLKKALSKIYVYLPSGNSARTEIKKVYLEKGYTNVVRQDTNLEIDCKYMQDKVHIEYEISPDSKPGMLSYSDDCIILTEFLITPAVYHDNKPVMTYPWRFGDPYLYDVNNYHVIIKADKDLSIYAPGKKEEYLSGSSKLTVFEAKNLRDFPSVVYRKANVRIEEYSGKKIYYINSYAAKRYVEESLKYAEANIGRYPYKEFFVVMVPIAPLEGMEFSNMIFLDNSCFQNESLLKRLTYHEVLHQWFYGIIGTDQLNEPFLDEGLVECLAALMCNDNFKDTYDSQFSTKSLNAYSSRDEYYKMAYTHASKYFFEMQKKMGNNFSKLLQNVYKDKIYSRIYFDEFLEDAKKLNF